LKKIPNRQITNLNAMGPETVGLARFSQCKYGGPGKSVCVREKQTSLHYPIGVGIHFGHHKVGHHQLHVDIVLRHLQFQGLGEVGDKLLARSIDGHVGQWLELRGGSQIDNGALSATNHLGQDLAGEHGNRSHVDGKKVPKKIL